MKIYLIGYMGCGKSTLGKELAKLMNLPWVDLDEAIEGKSGQSITALFSAFGEAGFRKVESELLREYGLNDQSFVMATGGGTPVYENNMAFMNSTGTTVYLKVDSEELVRRLWQDRSARPLLSALKEEEVESFVRSHFNLREPRYVESHLIWNTDEEESSIIRRIVSLEPSVTKN